MDVFTISSSYQDVICGHAVNVIIRSNLRRFCELCDTQIRFTDKEGTVTEASFKHDRAEAITAD